MHDMSPPGLDIEDVYYLLQEILAVLKDIRDHK